MPKCYTVSQPRRQTILSRSHQPHLGCSNQDPKTELQPDDASLSTADLLETGEYCDVYLTHDSMSVRKAHNSGRNHLRNVEAYYAKIGQEEAQSVIDSITASYAAEGQPMPNPAMLPPGAFPPPFGLPGQMPPPPFGIPPPGAPGAPGMPPPPGAHGLPFPPPFPPNGNFGTPPQGGFPPPPMPNMPPGAGAGNMPPPPGGFPPPNFPVPPPGAAGAFPPPMPGHSGSSHSPIPTGPRGGDRYAPPPNGPPSNGPPPRQDHRRW